MTTVGLLTLTSALAAPITVRVGFNPTQNSDQINAAAKAIGSYLEDKFGGTITVQTFVPTDYRGLIEAMRAGKLDFAFYPPDGYVLAHQDAGAQVLLKSVRNGSPFYWSAIVVRKDSGINKLADLEGKNIAWIDPNSAAGYTFPRAAIIQTGINPDKFFGKQVYAGKHDAAVLSVFNKSVDAAATFANDNKNISGSWTQYLKPDQASQLKAIFYTRPIPGDTFAVAPQFDKKYPALTKGIAAAIRSIKDPQSKLLMNLYTINYMMNAKDSDYDVVRDTRKVLGLDK
ncbi:phosphate/phosphite/phosphonate ABC transporter substrate-binding protein [Deinococcus rubellus]